MDYLVVRNWDRWQTYRRDRGRPPWIKVYRTLLSTWEFSELTDAQRGQLMCIWMIASDKNGRFPADPEALMRMCNMQEEPDLERFLALQFFEREGKRRQPRKQSMPTKKNKHANQHVRTETETEKKEKPPTGGVSSFDDLSGIDRTRSPLASRMTARAARDGETEPEQSAAALAAKLNGAANGKAAQKREAQWRRLEATATELGVAVTPGMSLETLSAAVLAARVASTDAARG